MILEQPRALRTIIMLNGSQEVLDLIDEALDLEVYRKTWDGD